MTRFESKVDWWIGALLALLPLANVGLIAGGLVASQPPLTWIGLGCAVFNVLIYAGVIFPLRYELTDTELVVRQGLLRRRVAYEEILGVQPSRNPISSPALSLDRLLIERDSAIPLLISPADRDGFLGALAERAPHLRREGEGLVDA